MMRRTSLPVTFLVVLGCAGGSSAAHEERARAEPESSAPASETAPVGSDERAPAADEVGTSEPPATDTPAPTPVPVPEPRPRPTPRMAIECLDPARPFEGQLYYVAGRDGTYQVEMRELERGTHEAVTLEIWPAEGGGPRDRFELHELTPIRVTLRVGDQIRLLTREGSNEPAPASATCSQSHGANMATTMAPGLCNGEIGNCTRFLQDRLSVALLWHPV